MPSHNRRQQRKVKRDIKRKVQAKHRQQTSTNKMDDMMKTMMLMMNGNRQQNPSAANDLLTAKETAARLKSEQEKQRLEHENTIKRLTEEKKQNEEKAKVEALNDTEKHVRNMAELEKQKREAKAKLRSTHDEMEQRELSAVVEELNQRYDIEHQTIDLMIQSKGIDEESLEKKHELAKKNAELKRKELELQQKMKEHEIEDLEKETANVRERLEETISKLNKSLQLAGRDAQVYKNITLDINNYLDFLQKGVLDNLVEIADVKDKKKLLSQIGVNEKLTNAKKANSALLTSLKELKSQHEDLVRLNDELHKVENENENLKRDIVVMKDNIERSKRYSRYNADNEKVEYKYRTDSGLEFWTDEAPKVEGHFIQHSVKKELANAQVENNNLTAIKKQIDNQFQRVQDDAEEVKRYLHDNAKKSAYNDAMLKRQYPDYSATNAQLQLTNEGLQRDIDFNNKKKKAIQDTEDENLKLTFENLKKQAEVDAVDDEAYDNAAEEAVKQNLNVQIQQELLTQKGKVKDYEREKKMIQWKENALNAPQIQQTQKQIEDEMKKQAMNEEQTKQFERLKNVKEQANKTKATLDLHKQIHTFVDTQGINDVESQLAVINDKIDSVANELNNEDKYVSSRNEHFRTEFSKDRALLDSVKNVMNQYREGVDIDNSGWFKNNLHTREEVDAFDRIVDDVASCYNVELKQWEEDKLNRDDVEHYIDILFPPQ